MISFKMGRKFFTGLLLISVLFAGGCGLFGGGGGDEGNLIGVPDREGFVMSLPFGMVPVPAGTFHMGQADEDVRPRGGRAPDSRESRRRRVQGAFAPGPGPAANLGDARRRHESRGWA